MNFLRKKRIALDEKWRKLPKEDIIRKYQNRVSSVILAEQYNCCPNTILKILRKNGVEIRSRGPYIKIEVGRK